MCIYKLLYTHQLKRTSNTEISASLPMVPCNGLWMKRAKGKSRPLGMASIGKRKNASEPQNSSKFHRAGNAWSCITTCHMSSPPSKKNMIFSYIHNMRVCKIYIGILQIPSPSAEVCGFSAGGGFPEILPSTMKSKSKWWGCLRCLEKRVPNFQGFANG